MNHQSEIDQAVTAHAVEKTAMKRLTGVANLARAARAKRSEFYNHGGEPKDDCSEEWVRWTAEEKRLNRDYGLARDAYTAACDIFFVWYDTVTL